MKAAVLIDFGAAYVRMSAEGRRWLRAKRDRTSSSMPAAVTAILENKRSRQDLIRRLMICDRAFADFVPASLLEAAERARDQAYGRLVPFAWFNLEIRGRLLEAFDIPFDRAAEFRLAHFMFFIREWNDLADIHGRPLIFDAVFTDNEILPSLRLVRRLFAALRTSAPDADYPRFATLTEAWKASAARRFAPPPTESDLKARALVSLAAGYAIMMAKLPERLDRAIHPISHWLYALDALADFHRDKGEGKISYLAGTPDPEAEVRRLLAAGELHVRAEAADPELVLSLMRFLTEETVRAFQAGIDIESEVFGAPPTGVTRSEDPSGPDTGAGT
jgi:hypothetical protein